MSYESGRDRAEKGKSTPASILDPFTSQYDVETNRGFQDGLRNKGTAEAVAREIAKQNKR